MSGKYDPLENARLAIEVEETARGMELPPPGAPLDVAREFVRAHHDREETALLRSHRGSFYTWDGQCWIETPDADLRSQIYTWAEPAFYWKPSRDGATPEPWRPTKRKISDVVDALAAAVHLPSEVTAPCWIHNGESVPAEELIPMRNGLLHIPTRTLMAHTPGLWAHHALPFEYDPDAPIPQRWLAFMGQLWKNDAESVGALQEAFGYILSADTSLQKMLLLVGPKRSGKGTIGRVLTGLLGAHNVAAPTLAGLSTNFGLSPLINSPLALISDARLSGRSNASVVVERLLSISGEDTITIDRKYLDPWTGRLPTRFVILTNELPRLSDSSGALASRFVILVLKVSFYGEEDPKLTSKLLGEAPGIFNWALDGLDRLRERGHFEQPASAREQLEVLEDLASPVAAFIRERCRVGDEHGVLVDDLFQAWKVWCVEQGDQSAGLKSTFGRNLRAAEPRVHKVRVRTGADDGDDDADRVARYHGIGLR